MPLPTKSRIKVEIILRTMNTLTHYVDLMGAQMAQESRVAENEAVLENIRGVSSVVEEVVQEYVLFEVNQAAQQYQVMHDRLTRWEIFYVVLLVAAIGFSFAAAWAISRSIYIPIKTPARCHHPRSPRTTCRCWSRARTSTKSPSWA